MQSRIGEKPSRPPVPLRFTNTPRRNLERVSGRLFVQTSGRVRGHEGGTGRSTSRRPDRRLGTRGNVGSERTGETRCPLNGHSEQRTQSRLGAGAGTGIQHGQKRTSIREAVSQISSRSALHTERRRMLHRLRPPSRRKRSESGCGQTPESGDVPASYTTKRKHANSRPQIWPDVACCCRNAIDVVVVVADDGRTPIVLREPKRAVVENRLRPRSGPSRTLCCCVCGARAVLTAKTEARQRRRNSHRPPAEHG